MGAIDTGSGVDASVLQNISNIVPDIAGAQAKAYKLKEMADTSQMNTMQLKDMKNTLGQKEVIGEVAKGLPINPTKEEQFAAVEKVRLDPRGGYEGGMKLYKQFQEQDAKDLERRKNEAALADHISKASGQELENYQTRVDVIDGNLKPVYDKFEALLKGGSSVAAASAEVQADYQSAFFTAAVKKDEGGNLIFGDKASKEQFEKLGPTFNPDKVGMVLQSNAKMREALNKQTKEGLEERRVAALEKGVTMRQESATSKTFTEEEGNLMAALAGRGVNLPAGFKSQAQQKALYEGLFRKNPGMTVDEIADGIKSGLISMVAEKSEARSVGTRQASVDIPLAALTDKGGIFDQLDTAAQKINLGDARTVSQLRLAWAGKAVANPDILVYKNLIQDARSEMAQALQKGGAPTEGSNARAKEMFPDTMSLGEYQAAKGAAIAVAGAVKRGSTRVLQDISSSKPLGEIISSAKRETGTSGGAAASGGPKEGDTASGPGGAKIRFSNGAWVKM